MTIIAPERIGAPRERSGARRAANEPRSAALFLDRDGVINVDRGYVHRAEQFEFLPGIFDLARFASQVLHWPIVVVSNQSGIGRGLFDEAAYRSLTEWMCERFRREQAPIARVYHCPFHPQHGLGAYRLDHDWRKPKPGMILQAADDLGLDLGRSAMIGDRMSDIAAAAAAGIAIRIRIDPEGLPAAAGSPPHHRARDLAAALAILREAAAVSAGPAIR
ncbi:MAG: HAD family hydrolase [Hyphomicrobiales bacterium]|nr:HAD family hydrolase [Hyphomicrobiales bacterium]